MSDNNYISSMVVKISVILFILLLPVGQYSASDFELYLVRHAEKAKSPKKDPPLTKTGQLTALAFATYLKDKKITKVYSSDYQRTIQTAEVYAKPGNISITLYDPRALEEFAKQLRELNETAYVVGHSNTTPELIRLLGGQAEPISEDKYGQLFHLKIMNDRVETTQIDIKADN